MSQRTLKRITQIKGAPYGCLCGEPFALRSTLMAGALGTPYADARRIPAIGLRRVLSTRYRP